MTQPTMTPTADPSIFPSFGVPSTTFSKPLTSAIPVFSNGDRQSTVVAPQALFMMNGSLVLKETGKMAANLVMRPELDDQGRVRQAYMLGFWPLTQPQRGEIELLPLSGVWKRHSTVAN